MSNQSDIDKALEMLKLLHPESHDKLAQVVETLVQDNLSLETKIIKLEADMAVMRRDMEKIVVMSAALKSVLNAHLP